MIVEEYVMTNRIGPVDQNMIGKIGSKIDETTTTNRVSQDKGQARSDAGRADTTEDTVALTNRAQLLERLEKSLETLPAVDSQRVAEIRTAIENGDYEIDAQAIADAMLRFERTLGE